jgi:hypothetical protein
MRFTYRLVRDASGYLTECVEVDAAGEGRTAREAVESLRASLEERMFRPDAVGPPPETVPSPIELALADGDPERTHARGAGGRARLA